MEWWKFHTIWNEGIRELSDAEAGRYLKALIDFEEFGEIRTLTGAEKVVYSISCKQLKLDAERIAEISNSRAEAGRKGGLKTKQNQAKKANAKQNEANEAIAFKNKELRIKNKEEELNNIAETSVSAQKPKLSPDDHEFWKFAKENAELAETFYRTTGIYPVKSQFGRWVNDLKDLAEADISPERLRKTIDYMYSENIPVSAPGSCLKTAQYLKSRGSVPVRKNSAVSTQNRWDIAAQELQSELTHPDSVYALFGTTDEGEVVDL